MDFDFVAASPGGSRWMAETAARRRQQRRLSSPSLRAYLTPAFDAVAGPGADGVSPYSGSGSSSSGGLDLGFDDSLLRCRRACFAATADLDQRQLLYSPQSLPVAGGVVVAGGYRYDSKRQAGGQTVAPGFQDFDINSLISPWQPSADHPTATARGISHKPPADIRSREDTVIQATKAELSTPKPEVTSSTQPASAQAEPIEEDEELINETLYGQSNRRRLPVFRSICQE
uniref:Uncharacterized protein n=1 Tax=Leersia perrieri TaxID=77586 RepID=A0A0D9X1Q3_9ORYZ